MKHKSTLGLIAIILLIIGGLNWGLVGIFQYDLVAAIFGPMSVASRVIYALVGLAALVKIAKLSMMKCECENKKK